MTCRVVSVAFVIVAFRNASCDVADLCASLVEAARLNGMNARAYVVLNDDSEFPEMVEIEVIQGQGNVGFAEGIAIGVEKSSEDYIVLVNPDCKPDLAQFREFLARTSHDGSILIPRLCKENGEFDYMPYENWTYSVGRKVSEWLCRYRLLRETGTNLPRYAKLSGAFLGMERATAEGLDAPFDSAYFLYAEDRDLTDRVRAAGIPIHFLRDVKITHIGGESGKTVSDLVEKCKTDGSLRIALRRYGRIGAFAFAIDQWAVDFVKEQTGRRSARSAHRWSVARWRRVGFSDPGRLDEWTLNGLVRS